MKGKLSYANVMATIAVFIALGGGAYAATHLEKNSVGTIQIKDGAVTGEKVKDQTLTGSDIKTGTLGHVPEATNAANLGGTPAQGYVKHDQMTSEQWHYVGTAGNPDFAQCGFAVSSCFKNSEFDGDPVPVAFYRDPLGIVHLEGIAEAQNTADFIFTLPPGYRPEQWLVHWGQLAIKPNGEVHAQGENPIAVGNRFPLDNVSFRCGPSGQDGCP